MGLIPIFLLIVLSLLLWGLVNYYSFISKKSQADLQYLQLEKGYNQRSTELLELHTLLKINGLLLPQTLMQLANDPDSTQTYHLEEELSAIEKSAQTKPGLSENADFRKVMADLEETEKQIQKAKRKYKMAASDYNRQVQEMPSRYIALVFGFKKHGE